MPVRRLLAGLALAFAAAATPALADPVVGVDMSCVSPAGDWYTIVVRSGAGPGTSVTSTTLACTADNRATAW